MHTTALGVNIKSQSAVASAKWLLCAGDAPFKTLMKFFLLLFGSPSAWFVKLLWVFLLYVSPYRRFIFSSFFSSFSCRCVFCLKAGAPRQAIRHVWMCSDTSSTQGLISQGKMGVWHVYILFPFSVSHQQKIKTPSLFSFPPCCKLDIRWRKTDADPSLTPKEEGAGKQELPWESTETPIRPLECAGHGMRV